MRTAETLLLLMSMGCSAEPEDEEADFKFRNQPTADETPSEEEEEDEEEEDEEEGSGSSGDTNEEEEETTDIPNVVIFSVSGHDMSWLPGTGDGNDNNEEYLEEQGTIEAIGAPFLDADLSVLPMPYSDEYFNWERDGEVYLWGFLQLIADIEWFHENWVVDNPTPPVFIMVAHSHGAVWAHTALMLLDDIPFDLLIDLDAESLGWDKPTGLWDAGYDTGDYWTDVILDDMETSGREWPFDIWNALNSWDIPGVDDLQDIEDVVPDTVWGNLELVSSSGGIGDAEPNHRLDGSKENIDRESFSFLPHWEIDDADSDAILWVQEELTRIYGL